MARARMKSDAFPPFELTEKLNVEPGQNVDLGTYNVATGKRIQAPVAQAGPADVPINGRIVDLEGRPVAGVSVRVLSVMKPKLGNLTPWLEAVERGEPAWTVRTQQAYFEPSTGAKATSPEVTTDAQGRFRFDGLDTEALVHLRIEGPTIVFRPPLSVVTRHLTPEDARRFASSIASTGLHGADFTYVVSSSRPVEGIVRDAKTNQPLAGVTIQCEKTATWNPSARSIGKPRTTTDAKGRFRLVGMPKADGNRIVAIPSADQPYFMQELNVPDPPGIAPVPVEFAMHRGNWIEGKVTDKETGRPVSGASVHYLPFLGNSFAQALPEFGKNGLVHGALTHQDRFKTMVDGTFRLVGLPGHAIVGVDCPAGLYLCGAGAKTISGMDDRGRFPTWSNPVPPGKFWPTAMKEINPPEGSEVVHLEFALERGAAVRLRVVDLEGKPVTGVTVAGRRGRGAFERDVQPEAEFVVLDLGRDEDRMVMVRHESRGLGKVVHVLEKDAQNGVLVVALDSSAAITGRVADADGNPVRGATVRATVLPQGDFGLDLVEVATGLDGRFRISDVPTGVDYSLMIVSGAKLGARRRVSTQAKVRPGETTDVGEVRFKGESVNRPEQQSAVKVAQTLAKDVPISGRIVDLEGRPVAGVSVKVNAVNGPKTGDLTAWIDGVKKGEPPWIAYQHLGADVKIPEPRSAAMLRLTATAGSGLRNWAASGLSSS